MNLPQGNTTPVLPLRYKYVLSGVYFHREYLQKNNTEHGMDVINVWLYTPSGVSGTGCAYGNNFDLYGTYERYKEDLPDEKAGIPVYGLPVYGWGFLHESGHVLGLHHTVLTPNGKIPSPNEVCEDFCSDTPDFKEVLASCGDTLSLKKWNPRFGECATNNMMDYAGLVVLTPQQINRVHYGLETIYSSFLSTSFQTPFISLDQNWDETVSVIARSILAPKHVSRKVKKDELLIFNAEEVVIEGNFEVEKGGLFSILLPTSMGAF